MVSLRSTRLIFLALFTIEAAQSAAIDKPISEYEEEARKAFAEAQEKIDESKQKIREHVFFGDLTEDQVKYEQSGARRLEEEAYTEVREIIKDMPLDNFEDELLKRQAQLSLDMEHYALEVLEFTDYENMTEIFKNTYYGPRRWLALECTYAYVPDFIDMYKQSDNQVDMQSTWIYWHNVIRNEIREPLKKFIELYKLRAEKSEQEVSSYYYVDYENENMLVELEAVMEDLKPLYEQIHGYIRHTLRNYYNYTQEDEEPIPLHFFEQTFARAWEENPAVTDVYESHEAPDMEPLNFTSGKEIFEAAQKFYEDMGFERLPDQEDNMKTYEYEDEHHKPKFHIDKQGIMSYLGSDITYKHLMQMHRTVGEMYSGWSQVNLPYIFQQDPCPGFNKALGEAVILSASSFKRAEKVGITYNFSSETAVNRLFHSAVHTLLMIPLYYVYEKMTVDVFSNKLTLDDFNCAYWDYMEKYLGVRPPVPRLSTDMDITYRFFDGLSQGKTPTSKLVAEILGFQLYKGWCQMAEEVDNTALETQLHNCDFSSSTQVGESFKEIISEGKQKVWRDLVEPVIGKRVLSADAILEYYEPLVDVLKANQKELNYEIGWKQTKMCTQVGHVGDESGTPEE